VSATASCFFVPVAIDVSVDIILACIIFKKQFTESKDS